MFRAVSKETQAASIEVRGARGAEPLGSGSEQGASTGWTSRRNGKVAAPPPSLSLRSHFFFPRESSSEAPSWR